MKYHSTHEIICEEDGCKYSVTKQYATSAVRDFQYHLKAIHSDGYFYFQERGRKLAKSQNGNGYYDDGISETGGWNQAQESFREAWTRNAIKEMLGIVFG